MRKSRAREIPAKKPRGGLPLLGRVAREAMARVFSTLDATDQARLVGAGEASPRELVEAAIASIETLDPQLNAVIHPLFEKARAQAESAALPAGPFRGVPMVLKDLDCHSAGDPLHSGMQFLRELGWTEGDDSYVAARLRAAGFVFVGRTNTPELGVLPTTEPVAYGPTRNPWNVSRSPGGSSGGSAAAVAAGLVPIGHGSDGGGSIRIPASACGLVGLKPSRGRVSAGPRHGELLGGLAVEHVLSRSVRDTAAVLDVLAGPMPGDPYCAPAPHQPFTAEVGASPGRLRIGVLGHVPGEFVEVHADCSRAAQAAGQLLESLGHTVEPSYPTVLEESEFFLYFGTIVACELVASLESWSRRTGKAIGARDVEPHTWALTGLGRCPATQLIAAKEWLHGYARRMASWWSSGFDLLVTSTLAHVPPPLGELTSTNENPLRAGERATPFAVFTAPFNATGQPAISLPLAWSNGLPIGVQLVAAYGREDLLIRVASQLEQARPWSDRRPPVSA